MNDTRALLLVSLKGPRLAWDSPAKASFRFFSVLDIGTSF